MPETKVRSGQLGTSLSSKTIDNTNTINTDLTKLAIAGGSNGQVLSTNGSSVLSWITSSGGGGAPQVQVDTITSTGTWTRPAWGKYFKVFLVGGGAGGGSGSRQLTTQNRPGGGGGAGAGIVIAEFTTTEVTGDQTVTIGAGGTGGASVTVNSTTGNNGTNGGVSSFGSLMSTLATNFGNRGLTSSGLAGVNYANTTPFGFFPLLSGSDGGRSNMANITYITVTNNIVTGGYQGGGGSGAQNSNTQTGAGATINYWGGLLPSVAASSGGTNGGNGNDGVSFTYGYLTLGTSGGGGSYATAQATGRGGDGSYGSGGGGGAGSDNGYASGRGGNGGNGICIILTIG